MVITIALALIMGFGQDKPPDAKVLYNKVLERVHKAHSLSCTVAVKAQGQAQTVKMRLLMPNNAEILEDGFEVHMSPKGSWSYMKASNQYMLIPTAAKPANMVDSFLPGFDAGIPVSVTGPASYQTLDGRKLVAIPVKSVAIGSGTMLVDEVSLVPVLFRASVKGLDMTMSYSDVQIDGDMTAESFAWTPPKGSTEMKASAGQDDYTKNMLKVGSKAPNFNLKRPNGTKYSLNEALKGHKALLVNFWFYG
jgi:outer membrane lipoprotein-sorting protein